MGELLSARQWESGNACAVRIRVMRFCLRFTDVWVLRYHGNELDDGFNSTTSPNADAKIDQWVNGESVVSQDVVIWYAAHFTHDVHQVIGHIVGPVLQPVH